MVGGAALLLFSMWRRSSRKEAAGSVVWWGQRSLAISVSGIPSLPTQQAQLFGQKTKLSLENLFFKSRIVSKGTPPGFFLVSKAKDGVARIWGFGSLICLQKSVTLGRSLQFPGPHVPHL